METLFPEFWSSELAKHKGNIIFPDSVSSLSYADLEVKIVTYIKTLPDKRQLIALVANNNLDFLISYLALLRAKHVILLLDSDNSTKRNHTITESYQANYIINNKAVSKLSSKELKLHPTLALLLSTSGSTGSIKHVKLSYKNLVSNTHAIGQYLPILSTDTVVTTLPLHYSFGLSILNTHLAVGASIVLTNTSPLQSQLWNIYKQYKPQSFYGVPFSFELLNKLHLKRLPLDSVRYFAQAGGRMDIDVCQQFINWTDKNNQQLFIMYGQTEATARMAYLAPNKVSEKPLSIGQAIPNGELCIVNDNGDNVTKIGEQGELCYRGNNVFIGYAEQALHLATAEEINWLPTGDIAKFDHDGDYTLTGRIKRIIKITGKRINLDEIEQYIYRHCPKTNNNEIVVTGKDELLKIIYCNEIIDNDNFSNDIITLVNEYTGINNRYISLEYRSTIPRLHNGKIDYMVLND